MAEQTISAAVGAHPALNKPDDVKVVQTLLAKVTPPLLHKVTVTGTVDRSTLAAIHEFQLRFTSNPDSRVDPDERTLWHLNDGAVSNYIHCSESHKRMLDRDIVAAQRWLDNVQRRLAGPLDAGAKRAIKNIFHIDADDERQSALVADLVRSYRTLRIGMDQAFPLDCEKKTSIFGAWVDIDDLTGTMHFPLNHFHGTNDERTERIIHERSHTLFHIKHAGMIAAGQADFSKSADDDNGFTYDQATHNAYCYGWLATALQPGYVPGGDGFVIEVGKPKGR